MVLVGKQIYAEYIAPGVASIHYRTEKTSYINSAKKTSSVAPHSLS